MFPKLSLSKIREPVSLALQSGEGCCSRLPTMCPASDMSSLSPLHSAASVALVITPCRTHVGESRADCAHGLSLRTWLFTKVVGSTGGLDVSGPVTFSSAQEEGWGRPHGEEHEAHVSFTAEGGAPPPHCLGVWGWEQPVLPTVTAHRGHNSLSCHRAPSVLSHALQGSLRPQARAG